MRSYKSPAANNEMKVSFNPFGIQELVQFDRYSGANLPVGSETEVWLRIPYEFTDPDFHLGGILKATAPIEKIPPGVNRKDYVFEWTARTFPHHISKQLEWNVFRAAEFDLRYEDHTSFTLSSELVHDFEIPIPGALKLKFTEASQRLEVGRATVFL